MQLPKQFAVVSCNPDPESRPVILACRTGRKRRKFSYVFTLVLDINRYIINYVYRERYRYQKIEQGLIPMIM